MKKIYIFASSTNPDVYINIITYAVTRLKCDEVELIYFYGGNNFIDDTMKSKIEAQFIKILNSQYLLFDNTTNSYIDTRLDNLVDEDKNDYKASLDSLCRGSIEPIIMDKLYEKLKEIKDYKGAVILDVTTLKKDILVNMTPFITKLKLYEYVYYFEKKSQLLHNHMDLIHNLRNNEFSYNKIIRENVISQLSKIHKRDNKFNIVKIISFISFIILVLLVKDINLESMGIIVAALGLVVEIVKVYLENYNHQN